MFPKIVIGSPIRNRAWILPDYLKALEQIDYPNKSYLFLENDSTDSTKEMLIEFCNQNSNSITVLHDFSHYGEVPSETREEYGTNQYSHLAFIRNKLIELFLFTDADYLFSVDSDIIVQRNILKKLLEHANQNTIIGAAISNVMNKPVDGKTPGNFMMNRNGSIHHPNPYPLHGVIDVDVIGAVYLIPRKALEECRYAPHSQGEDIPFCVRAKEKGYRLQVDLDIVCDHRMVRR